MPSIKPGTRQVDRSARGSTRTDRGVIDPPRGLLLADAIARERVRLPAGPIGEGQPRYWRISGQANGSRAWMPTALR